MAWDENLRGSGVEPFALVFLDAADNAVPVKKGVDSLPVVLGIPAAADVLQGRQGFDATTAETDLITIPQGRTWVGEVVVSCDVANAPTNAVAGRAFGEVLTSETGVVPAAGVQVATEARCGAGSATGTSGTQGSNTVRVPMIVVAPAGNAVKLRARATIAGSNGHVEAMASGRLY